VIVLSLLFPFPFLLTFIIIFRLVELFTNEDVEMLKDKKDKIQSRLFCKLITSLVEAVPDNKKGHYSSLAMMFRCGKCGKNVIQSISDFVPCVPSAIKIDNKGVIHSKHVRYTQMVTHMRFYITTLMYTHEGDKKR